MVIRTALAGLPTAAHHPSPHQATTQNIRSIDIRKTASPPNRGADSVKAQNVRIPVRLLSLSFTGPNSLPPTADAGQRSIQYRHLEDLDNPDNDPRKDGSCQQQYHIPKLHGHETNNSEDQAEKKKQKWQDSPSKHLNLQSQMTSDNRNSRGQFPIKDLPTDGDKSSGVPPALLGSPPKRPDTPRCSREPTREHLQTTR